MSTIEKPKTEAKLPLDSLEIKGYRCFKELTIPKLARVNLITGKNNVGKTSLLEAVHLWARRGSPTSFWDVLDHRDQIPHDYRSPVSQAVLLESVVRLFQGSTIPTSITRRSDLRLRLGPKDVGQLGQSLDVSVTWPDTTSFPAQPVAITTQFPQQVRVPARTSVYSVARIIELAERMAFENEHAIPSNTVWACSLSQLQRATAWDTAWQQGFKDDVIRGLHMIDGTIDDLAMQGDVGVGLGRIPYVKRQNVVPEPLSHLGEGANRLFDILITAATSSAGFLLIDEIENGLHYSVHTDVWKTIFDLASRLNVQVFATTHSWECIQAFEEALSSSDENDGELIRLEQKNDAIVSTVFEKRRVKIVAEDWIEVR